MYLLILDEIEETYDYSSALHSTMYLLILSPCPFITVSPGFTFHYVSINIIIVKSPVYKIPTLHSTMYLLIWYRKRTVHCTVYSLHSTMYLLISVVPSSFTKRPLVFTFHYVSINILQTCKWTSFDKGFTFHYVSINIPVWRQAEIDQHAFTFHYVSINIPIANNIDLHSPPLHSTMYLLISVVF